MMLPKVKEDNHQELIYKRNYTALEESIIFENETPRTVFDDKQYIVIIAPT